MIEERDSQIEYVCKRYKRKLPFTKTYLKKGEDSRDYYYDQGVTFLNYPGFQLLNFYTHIGVSLIEGWFINQILKEESEFTPKQLRLMILRNPTYF